MTAQAFEVPLTPATPQRFTIQLAGTFYRMTVRWCAPASCWTLDIADSSDEPMVGGIPLVTGADLLAQYAYLGIGGKLVVQSDFDLTAVPTFENLGTLGHLYFVVG